MIEVTCGFVMLNVWVFTVDICLSIGTLLLFVCLLFVVFYYSIATLCRCWSFCLVCYLVLSLY